MNSTINSKPTEKIDARLSPTQFKRHIESASPIIPNTVTHNYYRQSIDWNDGSAKSLVQMLKKEQPIHSGSVLRSEPPRFVMIHTDPRYTINHPPLCNYCVDPHGRVATIVPDFVVAVPEHTPVITKDVRGSFAMFLSCSGSQPAIHAVTIAVIGKNKVNEKDPRFKPIVRLVSLLHTRWPHIPLIHSSLWGNAQKLFG